MIKSFRTLALIAAGIIMISVAYAKYSDKFVLGTYSYLNNSWPYSIQYRDSLCSSMQKLSYNSSVIETWGKDDKLPDLLDSMDKHGIDAWITDRGWSNDPINPLHYAVYPLSTSAYFRLEAEFTDEHFVKKGDDKDNRYWYAFRNDKQMQRTGRVTALPEASYGYVFKAERSKDKPGYLLTDLRNRWPNVNGFYFRVGEEFQVFQKNNPTHANEYMWITYHVRVSNIKAGIDAATPLFSVQMTGFERTSGGFGSEPKQVLQRRYDKPEQETSFTISDYQVQKNNNGFFDLQIKVAYTDLIAAKLLSADLDDNPSTPPSALFLKLSNLNPRLYWSGNCDLEIDYVDIEDEIHHELVSDPDFWSKSISKRINDLVSQGRGNISGFYLFDEPYQSNFDSYRILQDILAKNNMKQFTATYDFQYGKVFQDKASGKYYDHLAAFRSIAQPRIIAPDIYPFKPDVCLNPGNSQADEEWFLQNLLDKKLLPQYEASKIYCQQGKDRMFMPIVQEFGYWDTTGNKPQWAINACPPPATQKALLYLPLCYGPDGIYHYRIHSITAGNGSGEYTPLITYTEGNAYLSPQKKDSAWKVLEENNPRILKYGEIIKGMKWEGADRIMLQNLSNKRIKKTAKIKNIHVKTQHEGLYEGYIQLGVYSDDEKSPWLMVVNRRTNYFDKDKYSEYRFVPASELEVACPEARPQILEITPGFKDRVFRKSSVVLYDPVQKEVYQLHKGVFSITLKAGEGKLLKLVKGSKAKLLLERK